MPLTGEDIITRDLVVEILQQHASKCGFELPEKNENSTNVTIKYESDKYATIDIYFRKNGWNGIPKELKEPMAKLTFSHFSSNPEYSVAKTLDPSLMLNWVDEKNPSIKAVYVRRRHLYLVLPKICFARMQTCFIPFPEMEDEDTKMSSQTGFYSCAPNTAVRIERELNAYHLVGKDRIALVKQRVGQGIFRRVLLQKYECKCMLCNVRIKELLVASHIKPWSASSPEEKLELGNGFLLCPAHDALFDAGYISFKDDGRIMISNELSDPTKTNMNVFQDMTIDLQLVNLKHLHYHQKNIFKQ